MKVFCFTCGNDEAQVVATKGEYNLVECTKCGCRWRRSLDPLYERTALVEVDNTSQSGLRPASEGELAQSAKRGHPGGMYQMWMSLAKISGSSV